VGTRTSHRAARSGCTSPASGVCSPRTVRDADLILRIDASLHISSLCLRAVRN